MDRPAMAIAVHGGAGREREQERAPRREGVRRAVEAGWAVLAAGGRALDAVCDAVVVLEDDRHFNAGRGSVLTVLGSVELDASVMEGERLRAGAVGAVAGVPNPVRLARALLEHGPEVMLVGPAARARARTLGIPVCPPEELVAEGRRSREAPGGETVGAVACDAQGHVAAATSTGGLGGKAPGRVGDSAIIGAGTYADDLLGAGSATGPGEAIIRLGLVRAAFELLGRGLEPDAAVHQALAVLLRRLGAEAGLVLVDAAGRVGIAHATAAMPSAYRTSASGDVHVL